jgi:hypothetical protein
MPKTPDKKAVHKVASAKMMKLRGVMTPSYQKKEVLIEKVRKVKNFPDKRW